LYYYRFFDIKQNMINAKEEASLQSLGQRLKNARLKRDETQKEFSARLGVSIPTLYKMERGEASIPIGRWAEALWLLDRIDDLDNLLAPEKSLFDQYEAQTRIKKQRQRASKKT
jgi:transcriptional regulator with XRE-family HTH domain